MFIISFDSDCRRNAERPEKDGASGKHTEKDGMDGADSANGADSTDCADGTAAKTADP